MSFQGKIHRHYGSIRILGCANATFASPGRHNSPSDYFISQTSIPPNIQGVPGRPVLYRGALHCAQCIARDQGLAAFYVAAVPGYLKVSPTANGASASFPFGGGARGFGRGKTVNARSHKGFRSQFEARGPRPRPNFQRPRLSVQAAPSVGGMYYLYELFTRRLEEAPTSEST